jgi:host factor-I protein
MLKTLSYQDQLLNAARKDNVYLTIFLMSGFQIRGSIKAFDQYVVLLDVEGKQQMVYKHAISTIIPSKTLKLDFGTHAE